MTLNEWSHQLLQPIYIVATGFIVVVILLIALIVLSIKLSKLRTAYTKLLGELNITHLEQTLADYRELTEATANTVQMQENRLQTIEAKLKQMKSKIAVNRFNAFGERGAALSFSVAILSEQQDGVVLTGIHNRDETYVYAKPIVGGQSSYKLTPEELEAINQCSELVGSK